MHYKSSNFIFNPDNVPKSMIVLEILDGYFSPNPPSNQLQDFGYFIKEFIVKPIDEYNK